MIPGLAESQKELDELLADFMGSNATVQSLVAQYISHRDHLPASTSSAPSSSAAEGGTTRARHGGQEVRGPATAATGPAAPGKSRGSGLSSTGRRVLVDLHAQEVRSPPT